MGITLIILLLTIIILLLAILLYRTTKGKDSANISSRPSSIRPNNAALYVSDIPTKPTAAVKIIPPNDKIDIDENGLPFVKDKIYEAGYGHRFNVFVTKNGNCYHNRKCPVLKNKAPQVMHLYTAIWDDKLKPCPVCKPKTEIDDWYLRQIKELDKSDQLTFDDISSKHPY